MDDEIKELMSEEIKAQIRDLANFTTGSAEKSKAIDDLATLYKLKIEEAKAEWDYNEKYDRRLMEAEKGQREDALKEKQLHNDEEIRKRELVLKERQINNEEEFKSRELDLKENQNVSELGVHDSDVLLKRDQMKAETWDRYFRLGVEIAGVVLPLLFYGSWMRKGFKFEETGTYTSTTFKGLFNRFKPTK